MAASDVLHISKYLGVLESPPPSVWSRSEKPNSNKVNLFLVKKIIHSSYTTLHTS